MKVPQVLILGGGFAGLAAAKRLRSMIRDNRCNLTLLDREPCTTMVPALPDYAAGLIESDRIAAPITSLLPPGAQFLQTEVLQVTLADNLILTNSGPISYDYLILAMGSIAAPDPLHWAPQQSYPLANLHDAKRLRSAFSSYLANATEPHVIISGAGYTGVELAICLARRASRDKRPLRISLLERSHEIMAFLQHRQRQRVAMSLARHGIELRTNCHIARLDTKGATLSDGTHLDNVLTCRTQGTCAPLTPQDIQLGALSDGRLHVTPALSVKTPDHVFAVGDTAAIPLANGFLRKAVNFAIFSGNCAGTNVARCIQGKTPKPFRPIDLGWVIPLGDDSVGRAFYRIPLEGKTGLRLHYIMCGYRNYHFRNFWFFTGHAVRAGRALNKNRKDRS